MAMSVAKIGGTYCEICVWSGRGVVVSYREICVWSGRGGVVSYREKCVWSGRGVVVSYREICVWSGRGVVVSYREGKPGPVPLCPPQILGELDFDRSRVSVVIGVRVFYS
jgi:hypothetical protein